MELSLGFFLIAVPAVMIAGISKGGFGNAAAFVAVPILALRYEPQLVLGLLLPLMMLVDLTALRAFWGKWDWPNVKSLSVGLLIGVLIATLVFRSVNSDVLRVLIGALSVLYVLYELARAKGWLSVRRVAFRAPFGVLAGIAGGFTGFVSHAGGPPVVMHLLSQDMDKTRFQATTVIVFWVLNVFKVVPYAVLGVFTAETLMANMILAPVAVISAMMGVAAHRVVPERVFFAVTYTLLTGAGLKLLFDGLT